MNFLKRFMVNLYYMSLVVATVFVGLAFIWYSIGYVIRLNLFGHPFISATAVFEICLVIVVSIIKTIVD